MALYNLARMTTATTGTGTITLGSAVTSYLSFADAGVPNAATVTYAIVDGNNREIGRGVYTSSGTTLTRPTILESTNSGSAISLTGNAEVFITAAAEDINFEGFLAYKSAEQTGLTSGADTQVTLGTEQFDIGSKFASNAWTPSAGKVFLHGSVYLSEGTGKIVEAKVTIKKDGSSFFEKFQKISSGSFDDLTLDVSGIDDASGSNVYTLYATVTTDSGNWRIIDSDQSTFFCGNLVGSK